MAIVLAMIGLIIGAVLKGEEMLDESRLMATMTEATAYTAAVEAFKEKYNALPGDMPNAQEFLNDCDEAVNFCFDGDGDKYIGRHDPIATPTWHRTQEGDAVPERETTMFWKHLALARLISGVDIKADPANFNWKVTHPVSRMKQSGWTVLWADDLGGPDAHYLRLQRFLALPESTEIRASGAYSVAVSDAMGIDSALDDGNSLSGKIQAEGAPGDCVYSSAGLTSPEQKNCLLFFLLETR